MSIPEACQLVLQAASMSSLGQILVLDMGTPVKIIDLARQMISLSGFIPDVDIKIEYSGLREGEKLYEELLASSENTLPTHHQQRHDEYWLLEDGVYYLFNEGHWQRAMPDFDGMVEL
jgi:FlaA1/EpsC-like NDP-sugar epimerase